MAGPVVGTVALPDDSGNVGKKIRTQTKVISAVTVHEHFFVAARQAVLLGVYSSVPLAPSVILAAAQNGTATGFLWGHVPTAITNKKARLRKVWIHTMHNSALATPTSPRLVLARMTFSGTASGATILATKMDSTMPSAVLDLRTAVTGLTPAIAGYLGVAGVVGALTAVGAYAPFSTPLIDSNVEDEWPMFAPGEGFIIFQDVAGTVSDTRALNFSLVWDEIDTA